MLANAGRDHAHHSRHAHGESADGHSVGKATAAEAQGAIPLHAVDPDSVWEDLPADADFEADAPGGKDAASAKQPQAQAASESDGRHPSENASESENHSENESETNNDHAQDQQHADDPSDAHADELAALPPAPTSAQAPAPTSPAPAHAESHATHHTAQVTGGSAKAAPAAASGQRLRIADPFILVDGAIWYAYGTGNTVHSSKDHGKTWKSHGGMVALPGWHRKWAPEVHKNGDKYVAYMTLSKTDKGPSRIFASRSDHPIHGWSPPKPVSPKAPWSAIDPTFFHDPKTGRDYLVWKADPSPRSGHGRRRIVMRRLDASGMHTHGKTRTLLEGGKGKSSAWEYRPHSHDASVEAPTVVFHGGRYWLFYSGAGYERGGGYGIGAASSDKITGPFHREKHPLLRGPNEPGHQSVIRVVIGGKVRWLIFFHRRNAHGDARYLHERQLVWIHGKPHIKK